MGLAFRTWLIQTPLVSECADKLQGSTYYQLIYHVKRRKYESFKTWALVVDGMRAMNRLGLLRWRSELQKKVLLAWADHVLVHVRRKTRNDRRSIVHRVRLHLKMKQYYFARWSGEAFRTFRLAALEKTFAERRRTACLGRAFKKWRTVHLIFLYERKKKSLQSVVTWRWLTKYTSLFTESETRIQELEKECGRLYTWEKTTCRELKEAAAALEIGDETKRRLEKELADAKVEAVRSKEEGFLQAMEASRNLLPNVSKNISMLSLAHLNLKSNVQVGTEDERSPKLGEIVGLTDCNSTLSLSLSLASPISWSQNELEVCKEQMQTYFKALANKMFAEQSKTEEKVKSLENYYEKNIVMILSMLRDPGTEEKISTEGLRLEEVLPVILAKISQLMEVKDDADAALNAKQIQLDLATRNSDEQIQSLKESAREANEALVGAKKSIENLRSDNYAKEKELEQLRDEVGSQKKVYDLLYKKHTDLSDHFVKTSEKSNSEMGDILKLKDEEIRTLQESCDGLRKRMEEQQTGHNQETSLLHEMTNDLQENLEAALNDLAKSKRQCEELNVKGMSFDLDIEKEQIRVQDLEGRYAKCYDDLQVAVKEKLGLKARLDKSEAENLELRNANDAGEEAIAEKDSRLEQVRQQNTELEAHKENYVLEIKELKAEIEALQESVVVRSTKLQDIEQTKMELVTNAMVYEEQISSLKSDMGALQDTLAKRQAKVSDLEQQKSELESLVDGYLENNVELNNEKESLNQSIAKKVAKIKDLEAANGDLEARNDQIREEVRQLKSERAKLEQSLERTAKTLEDKEGGMSEKASQLDELQRKLADHEDKSERQREEISSLQSDKEKLREAVDRKALQVKAKDELVSEKALQLSKLEGRVEAQAEEIHSLKSDREKLQQQVEKKQKQLQDFGNLEGAHAKLEAVIENQADEIRQLTSEKERLALSNDKRSIQLKAKDSDISLRLSQLDDAERKISKLQADVDAQKSEQRVLRSENERLSKKTEEHERDRERLEEIELEMKECKADMRDLEKVKGTFVKHKGLLSIIYDRVTNKQVEKLAEVETDVKEITCIVRNLTKMSSENAELTKELDEMKLLTQKMKELQRRSKKKKQTSTVQVFKSLNRRASFVPTQLPSQVWADETNRPKVSDLVNANEALLSKIEQKVKVKCGPITDMVSVYIMRKAFAVWLQAVGSEKALERLKVAGVHRATIDAGSAFAAMIPDRIEE